MVCSMYATRTIHGRRGGVNTHVRRAPTARATPGQSALPLPHSEGSCSYSRVADQVEGTKTGFILSTEMVRGGCRYIEHLAGGSCPRPPLAQRGCLLPLYAPFCWLCVAPQDQAVNAMPALPYLAPAFIWCSRTSPVVTSGEEYGKRFVRRRCYLRPTAELPRA